MKKLSLLVLFTLICMVGAAQSAGTHIKFDDVSVDGPMNAFVSQLTQKGYTLIANDGEMAMLEGEFSSVPGCSVLVQADKSRDLVYGVVLAIPIGGNWAQSIQAYADVKVSMEQHFGKPVKQNEGFLEGHGLDDASKLTELEQGYGKFETTFMPEGGALSVTLGYRSDSGSYVEMLYIDRQNYMLISGGK